MALDMVMAYENEHCYRLVGFLRKEPRKQMWAFLGKSGNLSLLSYFKYAESKNVSYQILISRGAFNFHF